MNDKMINIKQIDGRDLKKRVGADRVIKRYHNKHKSGSGNFGYTIRMPDDSVYDITGDYGRDGTIYNLKVDTSYIGYRSLDQKDIDTINRIKRALYDISVGR